MSNTGVTDVKTSRAKKRKQTRSTKESKPAPSLSFEHVLLLDPGFRDTTGHHFNNNLAITRAAADLNCTIRVLSGDTLGAAGELEPHVSRYFATDLYGGANVFQDSWEFDSWLHVNAQFAEDLSRLDGDTLDWADVILVPAITQFHMLSLARFLVDTLTARPQQKAVIQLMFSPTWTAWDSVCTSGPQMYQEALELLEPFVGTQLAYFSELKASCKEFEPLTNHPVNVLPHPGIWPDRSSKPSARSARSAAQEGVIKIGFFGYAKREKGFQLLPDIIKTIRKSHGPEEVSFVVHVNHGNYDGEIIAADAALNAMSPVGLKLLQGSLSSEDYLRHFSAVDIALLPYDPELYRGRGSGVFSEAIGYGKIIVAPLSSGVGDEVLEGKGSGALFETHDALDVSHAVLETIENFSKWKTASGKLAKMWRADHSGPSYLMTIENTLNPAS